MTLQTGAEVGVSSGAEVVSSTGGEVGLSAGVGLSVKASLQRAPIFPSTMAWEESHDSEKPLRTCPEGHFFVVMSVYAVPYGESGGRGTFDPSDFMNDIPEAALIGSGDTA